MNMLPAGIIYALLNAVGGNACTGEHSISAALEIRLRRCASFRENLRQMIGKYSTKKGAGKRPFRSFRECRIRGEF
jgi:hypothetical protein